MCQEECKTCKFYDIGSICTSCIDGYAINIYLIINVKHAIQHVLLVKNQITTLIVMIVQMDITCLNTILIYHTLLVNYFTKYKDEKFACNGNCYSSCLEIGVGFGSNDFFE